MARSLDLLRSPSALGSKALTPCRPHVEGWFIEAGSRQSGAGRAIILAIEQWFRQPLGSFGIPPSTIIQSLSSGTAGLGSSGNASISGSTLALTSNWTQPSSIVGQTLMGTGVPAGTLVTALLSSTAGQRGATYSLSTTPGTVAAEAVTAGATYTLSTAVTTPTANNNLVGLQNTGQGVFPPVAYLDAASGGNLTLHPGIESRYTGAIQTWRLPASHAYTVLTTAGSSTVTITVSVRKPEEAGPAR